MNAGILAALGAYTMWGVFPLYLRLLRGVPAIEVLLQRMVWSLVVLAIVLGVLRRWRWIGDLRSSPGVVGRYAVSAVLIAINWFIYIWSVENGHVVDASLGYFITPLFSVLLGRIVLKERPRPLQWTAIAIAATGVLWLAVQAGHVPWIGLALAASFSAYGLAKKTAPLGAIEGLTLETGLLFPVALAVLAWFAAQGQSAFATGDLRLQLLIVGAGPVTALPLLLFGTAARRIPMATLGLLQYVSPTLQLTIAVVVFGEPFGRAALAGYLAIWFALALYAGDGIRHARRPAPTIATA